MKQEGHLKKTDDLSKDMYISIRTALTNFKRFKDRKTCISQVLACGDIIYNLLYVLEFHCRKNPNHVLMHFYPNTYLIFRVTTTIINMSRLILHNIYQCWFRSHYVVLSPLSQYKRSLHGNFGDFATNRGFNLTINRDKFKIKRFKVWKNKCIHVGYIWNMLDVEKTTLPWPYTNLS